MLYNIMPQKNSIEVLSTTLEKLLLKKKEERYTTTSLRESINI